jgi:hypothetical protein
MGWETRASGRYYYRKERGEDGTVRSVYMGKGYVPESYEIIQRGREMERRLLRLDTNPVDDALSLLAACEDETRELTRAHLIATGHRTHRGQWRRRRIPPSDCTQSNTDPAMPQKTRTVDLDVRKGDEEGFRLLNACNTDNPKHSDVLALRRWLLDNPKNKAGHLAEAARAEVIELCARSPNKLRAELIRFEMEEGERALLQGGDGPLERAIAAQIATAHAVLTHVQERYALALQGSYGHAQGEHWEKRLTLAQRRYLRACEALERVRKLKRRGPVQVNVAAQGGTFQQVNGG